MPCLFFFFLRFLFIIMCCAGCAGMSSDTRQGDDKGRLADVKDSVRTMFEGPRGLLIEKYQKMAVEYEKAGEIQWALACWRVVSSLDSENLKATEKVLILKEFSREKAEKAGKVFALVPGGRGSNLVPLPARPKTQPDKPHVVKMDVDELDAARNKIHEHYRKQFK